jgi:TonB-dependent starch-binding outer membrane protein SusC
MKQKRGSCFHKNRKLPGYFNKTTATAILMMVTLFSFGNDIIKEGFSNPDNPDRIMAVYQARENSGGFNDLSGEMQQQQKTIRGTVTDKTGATLPGVSVIVKGTTIGVSTNSNGTFTLQIPDNARTLVVSFVGMVSQEIPVGNQTSFNIQLEESSIALEEVVAVGYGTVKKSDVTGALTRVTAETLQERPVQNAIQALQGKAAGIDIISNIKPGELPNIVIRGNRSIKASNDPLYVIDGIPLAAGSLADLNPADISSIEILKDASATAIYGSRGANGVVLVTTKKGTKGKVTIDYTNTISFDSYKSLTDWMSGSQYVERWRLALMNGGLYGTEKFTNLNTPVVLGYPDPAIDISKFGLSADPTARESVLMAYEWEDKIGGTVKKRATTAEEKAMGWPDQVPVYNPENVRSYDWRKDALRVGLNQSHQISLSSGTDVSRIYLSFAYLDQLGVQKDQDYERYTFNMNGDITAAKWLTIGASVNASLSVQNFGIQGPNTSNTGSKDLYSRANDQFPYALPKDTAGVWIRNPGGNLSLWNPLIDIDQVINERRIASVFANSFGEIVFTPWLKYRLNFGTQFRQYRSGAWTGPLATSHLTNKPNTAGYGTNQSFAWVAENLLYFQKKFADIHDIGITLLQSAQKFRNEGISASGSSMIYEISKWYDVAANLNGKPDGYGTSFTENALMSYMARLNYSLMDKYLLTVSGRQDGSSVLATGHKWDFFPSFAVAWKVQQEGFMKSLSWINALKLRLGYGVTGNSAVSPYTTTGPLSKNPYVFGSVAAIGYLPQVVANPMMAWEKTGQWNLGVDFGFLNNRVAGSIELYKSSTSDLLLDKSLPAVSGYVSKTQNIGKTTNKGIEVTLTTDNIRKKDFQWTTEISFTANREEIVELLNKDASGKPLDMLANRWFIGHPIQVYYNYQNDGIWQNTPEDLAEMAKFNANGHKFYPGTIKVVDQKTVDSDADGVKDAGDYKITGDDYVILGTNRPKWSGGITNVLRYKNLELVCFVYARIGQMYFGGYPNSYGGVYPNGRVENDVWSWTNPNGRWPMPNLGNVENLSPAMNFNDGSFVTVRNISLSYTLPEKLLSKIPVKRLSVIGQVINPFIFGGDVVKMGLNPEDNTNWDVVSSNLGPLGGMNNNTILVQSFVVGLKVGF